MGFGPILKPEDCGSVITEVDSSLCDPEVRAAQLQRLMITLLDGDQDFEPHSEDDPVTGVEVNDPEAWSDRIDQTATIPGFIIILHVIGEMSDPEDEEQDIAMGLTRVLSRTQKVTAFLPETSKKINELMYQWAKFGATVGVWGETSQPTLIGNGEGIHMPIQMSIKAGQVIPRERNGIHGWNITGTWKTLAVPQMDDSPVPATPTPAAS